MTASDDRFTLQMDAAGGFAFICFIAAHCRWEWDFTPAHQTQTRPDTWHTDSRPFSHGWVKVVMAVVGVALTLGRRVCGSNLTFNRQPSLMKLADLPSTLAGGHG